MKKPELWICKTELAKKAMVSGLPDGILLHNEGDEITFGGVPFLPRKQALALAREILALFGEYEYPEDEDPPEEKTPEEESLP